MLERFFKNTDRAISHDDSPDTERLSTNLQKKMNRKELSIRIPVTVLKFIAGAIAIAAIGYFGAKQYDTYRKEKELAQQQVLAQQTALKQAQEEIEKLKNQSSVTTSKQAALEQKIPTQTLKTNDIAISSSDIKNYLSAIVPIICWKDLKIDHTGSGTLWDDGSSWNVLTNKHVVSSEDNCTFYIEAQPGDSNGGNQFLLGDLKTMNNKIDISLVKILGPRDSNPKALISSLNYSLSSIRKCSEKIPIGSPVVLIGYPAFGSKYNKDLGGTVLNQITSNGIISGYDDTPKMSYSLQFHDYFVSAKIDSGNSGGIALSKDSSGICVLGVPTWLSIGNYETQGLVQNIHNIFAQ